MTSCTGGKSDTNSKEEVIALNDDLLTNCFNSDFYKCIQEYIRRTKGFFFDDLEYYSVYFFTKDSIDYFTIWTNYTSPEVEMKYSNPLSNFKYYSLKVNENDVVIVAKDTYNNEQLYQCCEFLIQKDNIPKHENEFSITYDGRWYIETYSYSLQDGKYVLNKLETPNVEIFGDLPEMFW